MQLYVLLPFFFVIYVDQINKLYFVLHALHFHVKFLNLLSTQRLLRKLDEIHLLDSSGNIIMSNIVDSKIDFVPPPEEAFIRSLEGKPVRITDSVSNRTSALVKLDNFIDTYLYIVTH